MATAPVNKQVKSTGRRKPPAAGMGRKKGSVNKNTKAIKDMILAALDKSGGEKYLVRQAQENPVAFMTLLGKILPTQLDHSGEVSINKIERAFVETSS